MKQKEKTKGKHMQNNRKLEIIAISIGLIMISVAWYYAWHVKNYNDKVLEENIRQEVLDTNDKHFDTYIDNGEDTSMINLLKSLRERAGCSYIIFYVKPMKPLGITSDEIRIIPKGGYLDQYFDKLLCKEILESCEVPYTIDKNGHFVPSVKPGTFIQLDPPMYKELTTTIENHDKKSNKKR